jgi:hypothetical protein
MKKINLVFAVVATLVIASCGSKSGSDNTSDKLTFASAADYNDFIIARQTGITDKYNSIIGSLDVNNFTDAKTKLPELTTECTNAIDTLNTLDAYNENTAFRDAAIKLFTHYKDYSEKGLKEQLDLMSKDDYTPEDRDKVNKIDEEFAKTEEGLYNALMDAQNKFAADNNMQIIGR